jgi:hypothetical protein
LPVFWCRYRCFGGALLNAGAILSFFPRSMSAPSSESTPQSFAIRY